MLPRMSLSRLVLPAPLGPTSAANCPGCRCSETSSITGAPAYPNVTPRISKIGCISGLSMLLVLLNCRVYASDVGRIQLGNDGRIAAERLCNHTHIGGHE